MIANVLQDTAVLGADVSIGDSTTATQLSRLRFRLTSEQDRSRRSRWYRDERHSRIDQLRTTRGEPDWDGYGAEPVLSVTADHAHKLLDLLPPGLPLPEVSSESDGHITFEWYRSPAHYVSVSVDPNGGLHYAATIEDEIPHGNELVYREFPKAIVDLICRVIC